MSAMTRRALLARTGWLAGGVTAVAVLPGCGLIPPLPTFGDPSLDDALVWVQLHRDGRVRFHCPRAEMGQGAATGLTQVVAEELGIPPARIECLYPTTDAVPPARMTVGSESIELFFEPTARAAALLREELRERAAARRGLPVGQLAVVDGGVRQPDGEVVAFATLFSDTEAQLLEVGDRDRTVNLLSQQVADRRWVGRSVADVHLAALLDGSEVYSRDVRLPGMAFGAVAHPPHLGARPAGWNETAALAVPGMVAVVEGPEGVPGVVAETPMAARRGLAALDTRWTALDDARAAAIAARNDIDTAIAGGDLDHTPIARGNLEAGRHAAAASLDVRYDTPMTAHAAMEPRAGVAEFRDGRCVVHTASQDPWYVRAAVARAVGLAPSRVRVENHRLGGAFGGRLHCQATVQAAWLARAVDRPVKVQWSREDEFRHNYVGPEFSHRIQAGVTESGAIAYWHHRMIGSPILTSSAFVPPYLRWAADLPADPGTERGTSPPYAIDACRVEFADARRPMPTGAWRGLGAAPNTFAVECAMDELAALAGRDPLAFRLQHALDPRLRAVIERVGARAGWPGGRGFGTAVAAYKNVTWVAVIAQVSRGADGVPQVEGLWCTHDCGRIVNPDRVRAQVEGNLFWGLGMALHEAYRLQDGIAATDNFDTYTLVRNRRPPRLDIELLDSDQAPSGAGEAAFAPAAAAIVNALASYDGRRCRSLPAS